jgi:hypothetical protein
VDYIGWFLSSVADALMISATALVDFFALALIRLSHLYIEFDKKFRGLLGPLIGAIVAWWALRTNAAINLRNKRLDVILHCNIRYDALYELRKEIESEGGELNPENPKIRTYVRRYWGLKSDQLDYWLAGYVDPETISSWFMSTVDSLLDKDRHIKGLRLMDHLTELSKSHQTVNSRLVDLVKFIIRHIRRLEDRDHRYAALMQYLRIIERDEGRLIGRLSRNNHRRFWIAQFFKFSTEEDFQNFETMNPNWRLVKFLSLSRRRLGSYAWTSRLFISGNILDTEERLIRKIYDVSGLDYVNDEDNLLIESVSESR